MKIAIIDTETTGFDPEKDEVIEVGAIIFDVPTMSILTQFSTLLFCNENPAEHINRISIEAAQKSHFQGLNWEPFWKIIEKSDIVAAHQIDFDLKFLDKRREEFEGKTLLCTLNDFSFPKSKAKKLTEIALDHNVPVWQPHRALTDCKLIADIFSTYTSEELTELIRVASQPKYLYRSLEAYPGTESKKAGFTWDKIIPKTWVKKMRYEDTLTLPFRCVEVITESTV